MAKMAKLSGVAEMNGVANTVSHEFFSPVVFLGVRMAK